MQSMTAALASLFGLEAAEEMLGPRKVMVPGITWDDCLKGAREITPPGSYGGIAKQYYLTKMYNPVRGALQQELVMGEPGRWRTGDWMGREGASVADLFHRPSILPIRFWSLTPPRMRMPYSRLSWVGWSRSSEPDYRLG